MLNYVLEEKEINGEKRMVKVYSSAYAEGYIPDHNIHREENTDTEDLEEENGRWSDVPLSLPIFITK